jgi:hypothetical protein
MYWGVSIDVLSDVIESTLSPLTRGELEGVLEGVKQGTLKPLPTLDCGDVVRCCCCWPTISNVLKVRGRQRT